MKPAMSVFDANEMGLSELLQYKTASFLCTKVSILLGSFLANASRFQTRDQDVSVVG